MVFIDDLIGIIGAYFGSGMAEYWFFPCIAIAFVATVPCLIRYLTCWR